MNFLKKKPQPTLEKKLEPNKSELLKEVAEIVIVPKVEKWYTEHLGGKSQYYTLQALDAGVIAKEITLQEALAIALLVGVQWDEQFEGVP